MEALLLGLLGFLISLVVSTIIIFMITKLFGEKEGFGTAILAALVGSLIFGLIYFFFGTGVWWATLLAGISWLIALSSLYNMGWLKSLVIAVFIWLLATLISYALPTVIGPL